MTGIGRLDGDVRCPNCDRRLDGWADGCGGAEDGPPEPGDASICWYCTMVNVFTVNPLTGTPGLRRPTGPELARFLADPDVRALLTRRGYHP